MCVLYQLEGRTKWLCVGLACRETAPVAVEDHGACPSCTERRLQLRRYGDGRSFITCVWSQNVSEIIGSIFPDPWMV